MSFISRALEDVRNSVRDFQSSSKLIHRSFSAEYQKEPVRLKVDDACCLMQDAALCTA